MVDILESKTTPIERRAYATCFFVPDCNKEGVAQDDIDALFQLGCELAALYNQESFVFSKPCEPPLYYNHNGTVNTNARFTGEAESMNYAEQYFTTLLKIKGDREFLGLTRNPLCGNDNDKEIRRGSGEMCTSTYMEIHATEPKKPVPERRKSEAELFIEKTRESLSSIGVSSPQVDKILRASAMEVIRESNLSKMEQWVETHEIAIIYDAKYLDYALYQLGYDITFLSAYDIEHYGTENDPTYGRTCFMNSKVGGRSFLVYSIENDPMFYANIFKLAKFFRHDHFVYKKRGSYPAVLVSTNAGYEKQVEISNQKLAVELMRRVGDIDYIFGPTHIFDTTACYDGRKYEFEKYFHSVKYKGVNLSLEWSMGFHSRRWVFEISTLRGMSVCGDSVLKEAGIKRKQ